MKTSITELAATPLDWGNAEAHTNYDPDLCDDYPGHPCRGKRKRQRTEFGEIGAECVCFEGLVTSDYHDWTKGRKG